MVDAVFYVYGDDAFSVHNFSGIYIFICTMVCAVLLYFMV